MSFSSMEVKGADNIPKDGMVILAPNHCNTLMDPLVVLSAMKGNCSFGARADIFKNPKAAKILRELKIVPMARARDGREAVENNREIFSEVVDCIGNGVPFCIFTEGTHRAKHSLLPLKKGIVKIAQLATETFNKPVYIVPVGLDYEYYYTYMCRCKVTFGEAIVFHNGDDAAHTLATLHDRLSKLFLYFPDDENYDESLERWEEQHREKKKWWMSVLALLSLPLFLACGIIVSPILIVSAILIARLKDKVWSNTVRFGCRYLFTPVIWAPHSVFYFFAYFYKKNTFKMKKLVIPALILICSLPCAAKNDIVKTGYNLGPLPVIAYDADKGLQLGAIVQLFNYGDGTNYPNYNSKLYLEGSFFTKGSTLFQLMYDNKTLIPGVRWSSAVSLAFDKGMDFYGFNGYRAYYDYNAVAAGKASQSYTFLDGTPGTAIFTPFYKVNRTQILFKSDFIGKITNNFKWEAGYHGSFFKEGTIDYDNINKNKSEVQAFPKDQPTLYDYYRKWGLISDDEADGGFVSSVRLGLTYDSRDKEGAPTRGIWAEGHLMLAPKWLGTKNEFYRYAMTFRHYVPIVKNDVLTFAYRLNYEGTFGNSAPYYILPYITVMGENCDKDGYGGYRNLRGVLRNRVVGLDIACYTAEFRWRFVKFQLWKQNIALGLSAFSDGAMVTKPYDMSYKGKAEDKALYDKYMAKGQQKDLPHITFGAGFRFIMNENFIIAAEYGMPVSNLTKNSPIYKQDGPGAFYVNIGYLF